ncbi:cysteine hydrolase family protein [Georgenia subflava]|uniref:cysteine hydrolase family protein n=1 Tax=Georgenia subflava TaxID=1622177 RepID=UPI00186B0B93|nr:isochorismatase family cysteine hydrolase [Georgenia subflava]
MVKKNRAKLRAFDRKTALLCIDLQKFCCTHTGGSFATIDLHHPASGGYRMYFDRLNEVVVPAVSRLQSTFRNAELEVIHLRIQSLTRDGRDRSAQHKRLGSLVFPGSLDSQFIEGVEPVGDEIVINKTSSGPFSSTNLDYVLMNLGIRTLVMTGVETSECVESTARAASDRGYDVVVVEDATAAASPVIQEASIESMRYTYAEVLSSEEVVSWMRGAKASRITPDMGAVPGS